jgi:hypothetical protein
MNDADGQPLAFTDRKVAETYAAKLGSLPHAKFQAVWHESEDEAPE